MRLRFHQDIAFQDSSFNVDSFILTLRERIYSKDSFARMFHLSWLSDLDRIERYNIVEYVVDFIDPLFVILSDEKKDIQVYCTNILSRLIVAVERYEDEVNRGEAEKVVDLGYKRMTQILVNHCKTVDWRIQLMSKEWLKMILSHSGRVMIPYTGDILHATFDFLQMDNEQINVFGEANAESKNDCDSIIFSDTLRTPLSPLQP